MTDQELLARPRRRRAKASAPTVAPAPAPLTYVGRAERYVDAVLSGERPAGRLERLACERHRRDMAISAAGGPFTYHHGFANAICRFVESMPHVEGAWANRGETLKLEDWQCFIACSLNGWRWREGLKRRYLTAYVEVARKNGKSAFAAALSLFFLTCDGEAGAKVYSAATKAKQARLVFEVARGMAERAGTGPFARDGLAVFKKRFGLTIGQHAIRLDDVSAMTPLEAKKLDGLNPHFAIVDELHEHPDARVWDALDQARGARDHALLLAITTAGDDLSGVCYQQRDYLARILDGIVEDESFFGVVYAVDPGDDPFDEAVWSKANPNLGVSKSLGYMRSQATKAKGSPAALGAFLTKHLDVWTMAGAAAFDLDAWRAGERPELRRESYAGAGGFIGVDLATTDDLCAVVWCGWDGEELVVFGDYVVTEAVARAEGNEQLLAWVREGRIVMAPGHVIDDDEVERLIAEQWAHFTPLEVACDPWQAKKLMKRLLENGVNAVEMRPTPMNLTRPFELLQGKVAERRVVTDGDPVLRWMISNTIEERSGGGQFVRPAKRRKPEKIDGVSALLEALGRLDAPPEPPKPSVYETRGLRSI